MSGKLKTLKLSEIRENPSALRSVNRQNPDYLSLVDSIRLRGVMNPIVVREIPGEDGGKSLYGLVDGLHRYTASVDAGMTDIPCNIINMDDAAVMEAQLIGNVHRIETKPAEYSKHLQKILSMNPLLTMTQLAQKLARSVTWLTDRLGLVKLDPEIAKLVDEGKVNLTNAYAIARLPVEEQKSFVDRAMSMNPQEFVPTILARKKELDTAKRQGRDPKSDEFQPVAHLRKVGELKDEADKGTIAKVVCEKAGAKTAIDGFREGLKWALHLDQESVEAAKAKDDVRKKELAEQRTKAAAERAKKKAEEAAQKAAQIQTA